MSWMFGAMLKAARERVSVSQAEMARRLGVSASAVNRIESCRRPVSEGTVMRYAHAIGMRVVFELVGEGVPTEGRRQFDRRKLTAPPIG